MSGVENVPEFLGLHHHGEEPERAGYSLEELFLLSRSNFLQQRVLAINVLGKIIAKVSYKMVFGWGWSTARKRFQKIGP